MPSFINSNWDAIGRNAFGNIVYHDNTNGRCYSQNWMGTGYDEVPCNTAVAPTINVATQSPSNPTGVNATPPISGAGVSTGGVLIQSGQSWLEDLMNTILGLGAIGSGATHIPSTAHVVQQGGNLDALMANIAAQNAAAANAAQSNAGAQTGAQLGGSIQDFITRNSTLLLIAGVALVLFRSGRK